jgi:hypothetical protein
VKSVTVSTQAVFLRRDAFLERAQAKYGRISVPCIAAHLDIRYLDLWRMLGGKHRDGSYRPRVKVTSKAALAITKAFPRVSRAEFFESGEDVRP